MLKPKPKCKENRLEYEEIEQISKACLTDKEKFLFTILVYTGMRETEFIHLKKSWVDFGGRFIRVPFSQFCNCAECRRLRGGVWKAKTKRAARSIPILPEIKELLESFLNEHETVMEIYINRQTVWDIIKTKGEEAKLQHQLFPQAIRSTFASILADKGFSDLAIIRILGWSRIDTGAEWYIKLSERGITREVEEKW